MQMVVLMNQTNIVSEHQVDIHLLLDIHLLTYSKHLQSELQMHRVVRKNLMSTVSEHQVDIRL